MSKKAAKKKASVDITIELKDGALPDPFDPTAHKNATTATPDRVRWWNKTKRGRTVSFDLDWWPFDEPPAIITIKKHQKSDWFTISDGAVPTDYPYHVSPPLVAGPGPTEPTIVVED